MMKHPSQLAPEGRDKLHRMLVKGAQLLPKERLAVLVAGAAPRNKLERDALEQSKQGAGARARGGDGRLTPWLTRLGAAGEGFERRRRGSEVACTAGGLRVWAAIDAHLSPHGRR